MHAGVVHKGGFVDIDIESLVSFELKRGLDACRREHIRIHTLVVHIPDLGKAAACIIIFLCVIVSWNPPCGDISRHGELGVLFLDNEVNK